MFPEEAPEPEGESTGKEEEKLGKTSRNHRGKAAETR